MKEKEECYCWIRALQPAQPSPTKASMQAQQPPAFPQHSILNFPTSFLLSAPQHRHGVSYHLQKFCMRQCWFSFPFSLPKAPQPSSSAEQAVHPNACTRLHWGEQKSLPSLPLSGRGCPPFTRADLRPCTAKAQGPPAASRPHELCLAKSGSYFWRAASLRAAEPGCSDRKRKAPVFRTQSEVSQSPPGEDG